MTSSSSTEELEHSANNSVVSMDTNTDSVDLNSQHVPKTPNLIQFKCDLTESCPDMYRCPISKEMMLNPVMLHEDGQTYEQDSLKQWLVDNDTSPFTGLPLKAKTFTKNYAIQHAIDDFQRNQITEDTSTLEEECVTSTSSPYNNNDVVHITDSNSAEVVALKQFLTLVSLAEYVDTFLHAGFMSMQDLVSVTFPDLLAMNIPIFHARRLINAIHEHVTKSQLMIDPCIDPTKSIEFEMDDGKFIDIPLQISSPVAKSSIAPHDSAIIIQPGRIPHSKNASPLNINLLLLGDAYVGKTSLRKRLELNDFVQTQTTSGVELSLLLSNFRGEDLQITIWDPAGQERYAAITKSFFRRAHAAAIVFAADDTRTWRHVEYWMDELECNAPDDIEIILICNKIDLLTDTQAQTENVKSTNEKYDIHLSPSKSKSKSKSDTRSLGLEEEALIRHAIEVAANKRIPFYMTSAKSGECVKQAFEELVSQVLHNSAILERVYKKRKMNKRKRKKEKTKHENVDANTSNVSSSNYLTNSVNIANVRIRNFARRINSKMKNSRTYDPAMEREAAPISLTNVQFDKDEQSGCLGFKCAK